MFEAQRHSWYIQEDISLLNQARINSIFYTRASKKGGLLAKGPLEKGPISRDSRDSSESPGCWMNKENPTISEDPREDSADKATPISVVEA